MEIYLVGGAVRDQLLGLPVRERDWVVVGATAGEMERKGFRKVDPRFPVFLHPETGDEYALARRETKSGSGYRGFSFDCSTDITLNDDLARRDLTINAIALAANGRFIDPFGGRADLNSRVLKHVTPAFVEDPLRVLRLARFRSVLGHLGFTVHAATNVLAAQVCSGDELQTLGAGRIWRETTLALSSSQPAEFLRTLDGWGGLNQLLSWLPLSDKKHLDLTANALSRAAAVRSPIEARIATLLVAGASPDETLPVAIPSEWPIPKAASELVRLFLAKGLPAQTPAEAIVNWILSLDGWRRIERFNALLSVWRAVRPEKEDLLRNLLQYRNVSLELPKGLVADGDPRQAVYGYRTRKITQEMEMQSAGRRNSR